MLVNTIFEDAVEQILDIAQRFSAALERAGIPNRIVGGLAVFLHVDARDPLAARLTRDVDIAFDRQWLDRVKAAVEPEGFVYRDAAGVDMFLETRSDRPRSAVRADYLEVVPESEPVRSAQGLWLAPIADLVRMKLTSFRLKDQVHIQDRDRAGLIIGKVEASLQEPLLQRLTAVRLSE